MNDGGPAFPTPEIRDGEGNGIRQAGDGISLRDYIACHVIGDLIGRKVAIGVPGWQQDAAWNAYSVADAMICESFAEK